MCVKNSTPTPVVRVVACSNRGSPRVVDSSIVCQCLPWCSLVSTSNRPFCRRGLLAVVGLPPRFPQAPLPVAFRPLPTLPSPGHTPPPRTGWWLCSPASKGDHSRGEPGLVQNQLWARPAGVAVVSSCGWGGVRALPAGLPLVATGGHCADVGPPEDSPGHPVIPRTWPWCWPWGWWVGRGGRPWVLPGGAVGGYGERPKGGQG